MSEIRSVSALAENELNERHGFQSTPESGDTLQEVEQLLDRFDARNDEMKEEMKKQEAEAKPKVGFIQTLERCEKELMGKWKELLSHVFEKAASGDADLEKEIVQMKSIWDPNRVCIEVEFKRVEREASEILDELADHGLTLNTLSVVLSENESWKTELKEFFSRENVTTWNDFQERLERMKQAVARLKDVLIAHDADAQKTTRLEKENTRLKLELAEVKKKLTQASQGQSARPLMRSVAVQTTIGEDDVGFGREDRFAGRTTARRDLPQLQNKGTSYGSGSIHWDARSYESGVSDRVCPIEKAFDSVVREQDPNTLMLRASMAMALPDVKKFLGDGSESFVEWLTKFLMKYGASVYSDSCTIIQMKEKLSGKAREIFDGFDPYFVQNASFENVCKAMNEKLTKATAGQQFRHLLEMF